MLLEEENQFSRVLPIVVDGLAHRSTWWIQPVTKNRGEEVEGAEGGVALEGISGRSWG